MGDGGNVLLILKTVSSLAVPPTAIFGFKLKGLTPCHHEEKNAHYSRLLRLSYPATNPQQLELMART